MRKSSLKTWGMILRDLNIATAYGRRLIKHGENAEREAVRRLVEEYPAHGFIIDSVEAKSLFTTVTNPQDEVISLARLLDSSMTDSSSRRPCVVKRLDTKEASSGEAEHGEGTQDATSGDSDVDDIRNDHGPEYQGGGRTTGKGKNSL